MWKKYSEHTKNTKRSIPIGRSRSLKTAALCLALVCVFMAFAGCGAPIEEDTLAVPTPVPQLVPVSGGALRLPMPVNPELSNPLKVNTEELHMLFSLVFEGLVRCDEKNQLIPCLAENWSSDASGRHWTFNLRRGVKWHGTDAVLNARDVKYTIDKIASMEDSYYSYVTDAVESVAVVDEYTLRITMKEAGISQLYALIFPVMHQGDRSELPVGTGPYRFYHFNTREDTVTLNANEDWWRQKAYISTVTFVSRASNDTALASYAAGQLNMVPTSSLNAGRYREEGVTTVLDIMTQQAEMILVNHADSILQDVNVRKAIAYGIDRSELIANIYMYRAMPVDVPIAPDSWAYEGKSKVYDYDPARAKTLLADAGWKDIDNDGILENRLRGNQELKLTLLVNENTDVNARRDAANLIAEQLADLGIVINVETAAFSIADDDSDYLNRLKKGDFDLALAGFNLSRSGDIRPYIASDGEYNYGNFYDATLTGLTKALVNAADEKSYRDAASAMQLEFVDQLPCIMLYFRYNSIIYSNDIMGVAAIREPDIFRSVESWYMKTE